MWEFQVFIQVAVIKIIKTEVKQIRSLELLVNRKGLFGFKKKNRRKKKWFTCKNFNYLRRL